MRISHRLYTSIVVSICFIAGLFISMGREAVGSANASALPVESGSASLQVEHELQRSYLIDHYEEVAESGPERGENIYFHKCWVCHNQYYKAAPHLTAVMQAGGPDEDTLTNTIRDGNSGMPSFKTTLSDSDIHDVVSYLQSGKCCFEGVDLPANKQYLAADHKWPVPTKVSGGPKGLVKSTAGDPLEGIMVQLIAPNGVRTTVFSNAEGNYEFPAMQNGAYTLRIATPLEFKPYTRNSVQVNGTANLDEIVLEKISDSRGAIAPTPENESQLTGAELLWNLPGTGKEKDTFHGVCGEGCHSYQQILKNRYDERSWRVLVTRMLHHGGGPILNALPVDPKVVQEEDDVVVKWLAKVRGPDSKDGPLLTFPRPTGESTRVVVTEYEMPRVLLDIHDVFGDAQGNIWYTSHMTRYFGKIDPRTGIATEYMIPMTPGSMPGTHHNIVDKKGMIWMSENWARKFVRFNPRTEQFSDVPYQGNVQGNFALSPDSSAIWIAGPSMAQKVDTETGQIVAKYPFAGRGSYESLLSSDGNFWAGGAPVGPYGNTLEMLDTRSGQMRNFTTGTHPSSAKRGGFDPFGNAWFTGMNGTFVEIDAKAGRVHEYTPPTPYSPFTDFYAGTADKNGEFWAGEIHGRAFLRFNPKTNRWVEYQLPEPYAHTREVWVDNSTTPVTVWYPDYSLGRIVRIEPMD
ncbi:MAG TPA: carboxypeptidase regulatory-like domain-containing protein [Candidatus Acidoferrales bacterium]|nr:carboxypeptidase regulatory-like domain-containing protein [Candidatus Acidoferrales bacterium]